MRYIHITAGAVSLLAGAVALYAAKGSPLHRRSGMVFVIAMLTMTGTATWIATFASTNIVNMVAGLLTFYLVSTALLTVRPVPHARGLLAGLLLAGALAGGLGLKVGFYEMNAVRTTDGISGAALVFFGAIGVLAALLDARLLLAGSIQGGHRLARHLWRMTFAMWIATGSFFLGQAKFLPELVRRTGLNAIPVLVVAVMLFYWLIRVLRRKRLPATRMAAAVAAAAPPPRAPTPEPLESATRIAS